MEEKEAKKEGAVERIDRDIDRKLRSRTKGRRSAWYGFGMFGLIGWSVAVPSVAGLAFGVWLDQTFPGRASWALTFLVIGVALGCLNAWYWVKKEGAPRDD
jgi:ATP synthase protein I